MAENYRRNHGFEPQNGSTATAPDRFPRAPPSWRRLSGPGRSRCPIRHRALHILSPEKGPKTSKPRLTWTLGPGVTGLREATGADCGLFTLCPRFVRQRRPQENGLQARWPWFRGGMRADELRDLILDGLREEGAVNVSGSQLRPQRFSNVDGVRFDFAMTDAGGLNYKGTAAAVERDGKLTALVWLAPGEHYHDRDVVAVNRMLDGMQFAQ